MNFLFPVATVVLLLIVPVWFTSWQRPFTKNSATAYPLLMAWFVLVAMGGGAYLTGNLSSWWHLLAVWPLSQMLFITAFCLTGMSWRGWQPYWFARPPTLP